MKPKRQPKTKSEWQEAVDLASFLLHLDSARKYGLIAGGPEIDIQRCEEILSAGKVRGVTPSPDHIERLTKEAIAAIRSEKGD